VAVRNACRIWVGKFQGNKIGRSGKLILLVTTSVQKKEAGGFPKTLVPISQTTWHYIPEDIILLFATIKSSDLVLTFLINITFNFSSFFFSGFLAQFVMGKSLETCIRCGIWTATEIIQRSGCTYEGLATFSE
jgi:hypothetical protein